VLAAVALTVVILLGYGGYLAWNALTGSGANDPAPPADNSYEGTVSRAIFLGGLVLGQGIDAHLVSEINPFLASANTAIYQVATDRGTLDNLAKTATGPEADVIASTKQSLDALRVAMIEWRDAVVNLRLADIADAHASMDDAIALLRADLDRWRSLPEHS
jgi:hypothetical protein